MFNFKLASFGPGGRMRGFHARRGVLLLSFLCFIQPTVRAYAADPEIIVQLGAVGFNSVVVDSANNHIFISEPDANAIQVFDFVGALVKTIGDQYGASGLVIQGATLFVAQRTAGVIEKIDLRTLSDQGALATGLVEPIRLAFAGGRLWTAVNYVDYRWAKLASVTLTGVVTVYSRDWFSPDLAASSGDQNMLFMAEEGIRPAAFYGFDVSNGTPVVTAANNPAQQKYISDLAVTPDGTRVIFAAGYPYNFPEFSAANLHADGIVYPGDAYPSAVAVTPGNQGLLATGLDSDYNQPRIRLYALGNPTATFTASPSSTQGVASVLPHGLAMSRDGLVLAAITATDVFLNGLTLHVYQIPNRGRTPTSITLTSSNDSPEYGETLTLTADVQPSDGSGSVSYYADGESTPIPDCESIPLALASPPSHRATCEIDPLSIGVHSVVATFEGDVAFEESSARLIFSVGKATTALSANPVVVRVVKPNLYLFTLTAKLTAHETALAQQTVAFATRGTPLCATKTDANGVARCGVLGRPDLLLATLIGNGYSAVYEGNSFYKQTSTDAGLIG